MASLVAMPIIVVNMGGEMMYVLRQRLIAQNIDKAKAKQVLNEVIGAMFNRNFINELFSKPHGLYTLEATKHIFERLAHVSIMKLNSTSMSKLYDLMTMVFKYQLLSCRSPRDIVDVSVKHLAEMKEYVEERVQDMLDHCKRQIQAKFGSFSISQFWALKQTLCDFVQGRNIKVSLLLQEKMQKQDGKMLLNLDGPCPHGTPVPGTIRHFDAEASISEEYDVDLEVNKVAHPEDYDEDKYQKIHETLGVNLYSLYRGQASTAQESKQAEEEEPEDDNKTEEAKRAQATDELNTLADLIVPQSSSSSGSSFRLNLFASANESLNFTGAGKGSPKGSCGASKQQDEVDALKIDAKAHHKSMQQRMDELNFDVETGASKEADDGDDDGMDLLDLMDQAVESGHK